MKVHLLNVNGTYFENGKEIGQLLIHNESFQQMLNGIQKMTDFNQDVEEIKVVLNKYCPQLLEELDGLREGMSMSQDDVLRLFSGYDLPPIEMGCTTFMTEEFYTRNYDFSPAIYDALFITAYNNDATFTSGNSQLILGRLDGMNHHGLVVGLHFVNSAQHAKGLLSSTIVRIILEMCEDVTQAIDLLKELPHAASYNYSLLDRKGNFAVFEASPTSYQIREGNRFMSCVNIFQTDHMKKYNCTQTQTSTDRLNALSTYDDSALAENMHQLFSDKTSPLYYTNYDEFFGTLHTVTYQPKNMEVLLSAAGEHHNLLI